MVSKAALIFNGTRKNMQAWSDHIKKTAVNNVSPCTLVLKLVFFHRLHWHFVYILCSYLSIEMQLIKQCVLILGHASHMNANEE